MSLEVIKEWISKIPPHDRDYPLILYQGKVYSPNQVLQEVQANTPVGQALQRKIETQDFTTREELEEIAKLRLIKMLKELPPGVSLTTLTLTGPLTKKQLMEEIQKGTGVGKELIEQALQVIRRELGI